MFKKILIANRGEIACRVITTARQMGIATVAVYSDADANARHVALADEAVRLGPPPSRESYLLADKIIEACKATGAEAVHPGYGFLSENAEFARRVEEEGIVFIGPKHHAIAAMGDKIASKKLAGDAKVSTIPGYNSAIDSAEHAVEIARDIGYPVMIKASAGGGGKGLRVAFNDQEALDGFTSCKHEALNSFGDDRVFIEKFVQEPRHIEIQVLADAHGNAVYLNERECSIQRRHQKVLEEAPSPFISEATRRAMGEQAVQLAKAVGYQSAGTVEFVVGKDQDFYFLEMNTRLQVEHPVTELITGLDLVEQMIRVAAGEKLAFTQSEVRREGWAIECRINAEDPFRGFLPSTGRLVRFEPPEQQLQQGQATTALGVRVDTGVIDGGEIPMYYDSMIAKLIVHGSDRGDAIARMQEALNGFVIQGVQSNIPFQAALLAHPEFVAGRFNTGFIAEHYPHGFRAEDVSHPDPDFLIALAARLHMFYRNRAQGLQGQFWEGHKRLPRREFTVCVLGREGRNRYVDVSLGEVALGAPTRVTVQAEDGERVYELSLDRFLGDVRVTGSANGRPFTAQMARGKTNNPLVTRVIHDGARLDAIVMHPRTAELHKLMPYKAPPDMSKFVLSPMPGLLVQVAVQPGQEVKAGERVAVIEAMKMENVLFASADGVVKEVKAQPGDSLAVDQAIVEFE
ncbi:MAG TPA: acetyl/propionyl/methylcrotonyl-CoA carboxylase subunit alpha [Ottowia sp.]|uniref:acetyl/propionyl/methylcrotonyl-CoA carboxylase subunit alpha n=1 Tax=Ottowia sp. TaxID=1898956 RepID=UPI002CEAB8D2|nr:acetyl/propionyl/methylcrotonyl-CoA carboxylase subunit alpha [Ottowia sp.]HMN20781.1 acetyl/propionyl/methylcrotonyl-CoA carboxylase subunit alpha [Ottowia sp.]